MSATRTKVRQQSTQARQQTSHSFSAGDFTAKKFKAYFDAIIDNIETVIKGKTDVCRLSMVAIICEGHILFEDVPGTGKTMLARAIAQTISATANRISCTPDMLPADITGASIYDQKEGVFEFRPGPVFANILLSDEVNRASPKTQSALLEAMGERKVSADGVTYALPRPFLVLCTQNPIEQAGTFPLPEAQLDRFLFKLQMGYMSREAEYEVMFDNAVQLAIEDLQAVVDLASIGSMIAYASSKVNVAREVGYYIIDLVNATRNDPALALGASPRASIALLRASRALAASDGRDHVYPDDVRAVLKPILSHRIIMNPDAILRGETIDAVIERVVTKVKPPGGAVRGKSQEAVTAAS